MVPAQSYLESKKSKRTFPGLSYIRKEVIILPFVCYRRKNGTNPENMPIKAAEQQTDPCFNLLYPSREGIMLPERLNYPFHYTPHKVAIHAAAQLMNNLENRHSLKHNFGVSGTEGLGKMFGVLVVTDRQGKIGFLSAFSGRLEEGMQVRGFVPPVYDVLEETGFFRQGEKQISAINHQIQTLESNTRFLKLKKALQETIQIVHDKLEKIKQLHTRERIVRHQKRSEWKTSMGSEEYQQLEKELNGESARHHFEWKDAKKRGSQQISDIKHQLEPMENKILKLKAKRKEMSADLQEKLFREYTFLNIEGSQKSLYEIFQHTREKIPPSGAGECAAPKLFQYAFKNGYTPIALAEFWWGKSPSSEIRKHREFYPACRGKCGPILSHMLEGLETDPDPMLINPAEGKELPVIYEDEFLLAVHKPEGFLSVPGKKIEDSVYSRIRLLYPHASGPLIVHRLDMSTSGVMLIAKTKEVHQHLQSQFSNRKISKRYIARIQGIPKEKEGTISLPMRVDLDNRPCQLVCFEYGKTARTEWKLDYSTEKWSRIILYPHQGRTHQLRVHCAHPMGLNAPIAGDDLYGDSNQKSLDNLDKRLYLHAESLDFTHPKTGARIKIEAPCPF